MNDPGSDVTNMQSIKNEIKFDVRKKRDRSEKAFFHVQHFWEFLWNEGKVKQDL